MIDGTPTVELVHPILDRVDRNDDQDGFRGAVPQENVDEGDDLREREERWRTPVTRSHLNRFAAAHRMRENAAEASRRLESSQRFDDVVVHETNATDLMRFEDRTEMFRYVQVGVIDGMIDIHLDVP